MQWTTAKTRNVAALRKAGRLIAASPRKYSQEVWHCGSKMCVAGFAAQLYPGFRRWGKGDRGECIELKDGTLLSAEFAATEVLRLSADETGRLFSPIWEPKGTKGRLAERVKNALYELAWGAKIEDVSA